MGWEDEIWFEFLEKVEAHKKEQIELEAQKKAKEAEEANKNTEETQPKKASKKKKRCICKKKCKGPCKALRAKELGIKPKEKIAEIIEEVKEEEILDSEIPHFPGRKNLDNHNLIRDIKVEGINVAYGSKFLLEACSLSLNWG